MLLNFRALLQSSSCLVDPKHVVSEFAEFSQLKPDMTEEKMLWQGAPQIKIHTFSLTLQGSA